MPPTKKRAITLRNGKTLGTPSPAEASAIPSQQQPSSVARKKAHHPQPRSTPEQDLSSSTLVNNVDEEDEPLTRRRRSSVVLPPSVPTPISVAVAQPLSPPTTPRTPSSAPQELTIHTFRVSPNTQSQHQKQQPIDQVQPAPSNPEQQPPPRAPLSPIPLPLRPIQPVVPSSLMGPPKDIKGKSVASQQQQRSRSVAVAPSEKGVWKKPITRLLVHWLTTGDNFARTTSTALAKTSGGIDGVYKEAA
ncbi:hypothetical protein BGX26_008103, partial [Mortierella sp. AD094]